MESDRLLNPVFRQFYSEQQVVMEERRMRFDNEPLGRVYEQLLSTAYTVHPYRNSIVGSMSDLSHATATGMRKFYENEYRPERIVLVFW